MPLMYAVGCVGVLSGDSLHMPVQQSAPANLSFWQGSWERFCCVLVSKAGYVLRRYVEGTFGW